MICKECGSDPFKSLDYDKVLSENSVLRSWVKREFANHAVEKAEWAFEKLGAEDSTKWLQRKVKKQSKIIARLEEKLKKLNTQPYAEEE